jgi:hypothetical protein
MSLFVVSFPPFTFGCVSLIAAIRRLRHLRDLVRLFDGFVEFKNGGQRIEAKLVAVRYTGKAALIKRFEKAARWFSAIPRSSRAVRQCVRGLHPRERHGDCPGADVHVGF